MYRRTRQRFVDLFAGLGGFHVGLARLGHTCVLACEQNKELSDLYALNFGITPVSDIRELRPSHVPEHDILCAGFPCQPFSKAGEQRGLECDRDGDLFDHIIRLLRHHRPPLIILENVANLLRHSEGQTYEWMRRRLEAIGYQVAEKVLSPHQYGIPQIRERAFIVGSLDGLGAFEWPQPKRVEPDIRRVLDRSPKEARELPVHYRRCLEVWQEFLDRIPATDPLPSFPIWTFECGATYPFEGVPPALRDARALARTRGSFGDPLKGLSEHDRLARLPSYARGETPFPRWKQTFIAQNRAFFDRYRSRLRTWIPKIREFTPSLQKLEWNCKGERRQLDSHILQFRASGVRVKRPNWAPALVAMTTTQIPIITWESRYMTVRECSRLQGLGELDLSALAPTAAYRAIGNAVSADLVEVIAVQLLNANSTAGRRSPRSCALASV
jgi:DNA (cytosine-5)-methyltransferase 1